MTELRAGADVLVGSKCGCQFALRPLRVRVIRELTEYVSFGPVLMWVLVYELNMWGDAVRQRELLVDRDAFLAAMPSAAPKSVSKSIPRPRVAEKVVSHVGA